jgi:sulfite oxidase
MSRLQSSVTPLDQFYHRNHALLRPAAEGESLDEWTLTVAVESELANALDWKKWRQGPSSLALSGKDIKQKYRKRRFAAAIECAGNRRIEFNEERKTEGIEWDGGVIASLIWGGASLRGLLLDLGIPDPFEEAARAGKLDLLPPSEDSVRQDGAAWAQDVHVHFISTEETQETDAGERYAASISIATAMHPNHGCLLAYEHNGQPLTPAHGFPLREPSDAGGLQRFQAAERRSRRSRTMD